MDQEINIKNIVISIILLEPYNGRQDISVYFGQADSHLEYFERIFEAVPELADGIIPSDLPQSYASQLSYQGYAVYWNTAITKSEQGPEECNLYLPQEMTASQATRIEEYKKKLQENNTVIHFCKWENDTLVFYDNPEEMKYEDQIIQLENIIQQAKNQKNR